MSSPLEPRIRQLAQEAREIRETAATVEADGGSEGCGDSASEGNDASESATDGTVDDLDLTPLSAARDGLGPVLAVYVEARAGEDPVRLSQTELDLLHRATNDWLVVYGRQRGVAVDPDATVREAAELLLDTHNVVDVAAQLVGLPAE